MTQVTFAQVESRLTRCYELKHLKQGCTDWRKDGLRLELPDEVKVLDTSAREIAAIVVMKPALLRVIKSLSINKDNRVPHIVGVLKLVRQIMEVKICFVFEPGAKSWHAL